MAAYLCIIPINTLEAVGNVILPIMTGATASRPYITILYKDYKVP